MKMRSKGNHQSSRLMRIITIPIRILTKAKDFYVKSMNDCADAASYGNFMGLPGTVPRNFSVSSSRSSNYDNEDLRELIRSASASARSSMSRSNNNNSSSSMSMMDMYMMKQQEMKPSSGAVMTMGSRRVPRSCSVGMRKIDEDTPCDFGEEEQDHLGTNISTQFMYPRSKSYALARKNVVF